MKQEAKAPRYAQIASRVFDVPLLIHHSKLLAILNVLGPRLGFELSAPQRQMMEDDDFFGAPDPFAHAEHLQALGADLEPQGEGHFVGAGVAVIPVTGTLVQRSDWMTDTSGMQSYGRIERMVDAAQNDPRVQEVLYEFDTPGGEVAGAFDFADRLHDMRTHGAKPATSVVNEMAASAGYLLSSAAGPVVVNRTGGVGSIGVVAAHFDYSKAMEKRGVVVTFLYRGDKKVDANPYQPLSDQARKDWQEDIDSVYGLFVDAVARYTGLSPERVRETQAAMYSGMKAREIGLARNVNTFANEFAAATTRVKQTGRLYYGAHSGKESNMTKEQLEAQQRLEADAKAKAEQEAKAKAEAEAKARAEADAKAKQEAEAQERNKATSDRGRIKAILNCDEAKGREQLASHFALETDLSVDQAKAALAKTPKASKLDTAMESYQPGVKGEEPPAGGAAIDGPSTIYARRAEVYAKAQSRG